MDSTQPHCPDCDVVMRDVEGGWVCPSCGHLELAGDVDMPRFEGPSIHGG